jgi:hypothetical protein
LADFGVKPDYPVLLGAASCLHTYLRLPVFNVQVKLNTYSKLGVFKGLANRGMFPSESQAGKLFQAI